MATVLERKPKIRPKALTLADLARMFGPMPAGRIRSIPIPGTATAQDVLIVHRREKKLCELIDGVLVEKPMGYEESMLAARLIVLLGSVVQVKKLGIVAGEGGMLRLSRGLVRIPDVSFIAKSRLPGGRRPREPILGLAPNLAIEVLSESNTEREMSRKLKDYFEAGVQLVWFVNPPTRSVSVYRSPTEPTVLKGNQSLSGGNVVPGFKVKIAEIFSVLDEY